MHALLIGLISGYFFSACAAVHWSGARVLLLAGLTALLLVAVQGLVRRDRSAGIGRSCLIGLLGATLSSGWLAYHLHAWQSESRVLAATPTENRVRDRCPTIAERQLVRLEVVGLPSRTPDGSRFDARVLRQRDACAALVGKSLRVSWKAASWPVAGTRILAEVRLRAVRGSVSPGAFDHELHLARRGIRYSAYIVRALSVSLPGSGVTTQVARVRLGLRHALAGMGLENSGVLLALLTGDSSMLERKRWELLQATGTVHLLVISGLHVGLVAAGLLVIVRGLKRLLGWGVLVWRPQNRATGRWFEAAWVLVLLSGYVLFVGAGVAAVRAGIMFAVVVLAWSSGRAVLASALLVLVIGAVLVADPGAGLAQGFWLSFGLVAWLVLREVPARWSLGRALLTLHIGCALVLIPMLAWLGLPIALVSPVANLLSVPVVTLVLVPLVLTGGILLFAWPTAGELVFWLADQVAAALLTGLSFIAKVLPQANLPVLTGYGYLALGLLLLAVLLPIAGRVRFCLASFVLVLLCSAGPGNSWSLLRTAQPNTLEPGEFGVQVLDVGQGLAVIVTTANQTLLYDTGARFPSGFNYGDAVILPALNTQGLLTLEATIISHHDLDHAGAVQQILAQYSPERQIGVVPEASCGVSGSALTWQANGVRFDVLQHTESASSNDRSCILVVRGAHKTAVLAGDIEATAERALLQDLPAGIDLLVVPHHGSRTSSTFEFVDRLRPRLALVSAGFKNRFGHPHADVVARFVSAGACVLNTAEQGTIQWRSDQRFLRVRAARQTRRRRWQLGAALVWTRFRAAQSCNAARESESFFLHQ